MSDIRTFFSHKLMNRYSWIIIGLAILAAVFQFIFGWPAKVNVYYTYFGCLGAIVVALFLRPFALLLAIASALAGIYWVWIDLKDIHIVFAGPRFTWEHLFMIIAGLFGFVIKLGVSLAVAGLFYRLSLRNDLLGELQAQERAQDDARRQAQTYNNPPQSPEPSPEDEALQREIQKRKDEEEAQRKIDEAKKFLPGPWLL